MIIILLFIFRVLSILHDHYDLCKVHKAKIVYDKISFDKITWMVECAYIYIIYIQEYVYS